MDLNHALEVLTTTYAVRGTSGAATLRAITRVPTFIPPTKTLQPVPALDGSQAIRPLEALHELSRVTGPRYSDDLYDLYMQWGLLRYVGLFDHGGATAAKRRLRLSDAGGRITGNQRRVTSEELGIGFGAVVGRRWFEADFGRGSVVSVIDIDSALSDGFIYAGGNRLSVRQVTSHRPDYIIVGTRPGTTDLCVVRVLECKGTRAKGYAVRQLAGAVTQLEGVTVSGRVPSGLAVSTVSADSEVSYVAVDPEGDDEFEAVTDETLETTRERVVTDEDTDVPTALALRASWAVLADFGRNLDALGTLAPRAMRERVDRSPQPRVALPTPFGDGRGVRARFNVGAQSLTVWHLVESAVDGALTTGSASRILEAQAAFARRTSQTTTEPSTTEAFSALPDGSIFAITLKD